MASNELVEMTKDTEVEDRADEKVDEKEVAQDEDDKTKMPAEPAAPRRRVTPRRVCVGVVLLLVLVSGGVAGWLGLSDEAEELLGFTPDPTEEDIEQSERPVTEHKAGGVAELRYLIGLDADAGEQAHLDLLMYLDSQSVSYRRLPLLEAIEAVLSPDQIEELRHGRWHAVQSLERDMNVANDLAIVGSSGATDVGNDEETQGNGNSRVRRLRDGRRFLSESKSHFNISTTFEQLSITTHDTQSSAPYHLDRLDASPRDGEYTYHFDGTGVDIYIVDTGVRLTHEEFAGRTSQNSYGSSEDGNGHGTAMAGAALGAMYGASKDARLISVQVLGASGSGTMSSLIAGLSWIAENRDPNRESVVSMSLGGGRSPAIDNAVQNVINDGMAVIVAAGNEGADACDFSPANVEEALTVGSVGSSGSTSSFSNTGECVNIFAPGEQIVTASHQSDSALVSVSGTSPATAIVAGVAAMFLEAGHGASQLMSKMVEAAGGSSGSVKTPHNAVSTTSEAGTSVPTTSTTERPVLTTTSTVTRPGTCSPLWASASGGVKRSGRKMLVGTGHKLRFLQLLEAKLKCTCATRRCNVDLYLMVRESRKWRSVLVSRSRSPNERLRARSLFFGSSSFVTVAYPKLGDATCELCSRVIR